MATACTQFWVSFSGVTFEVHLVDPILGSKFGHQSRVPMRFCFAAGNSIF